MSQIVGIIAGLIAGLIWEKLSTMPWDGHPTLIRSLILNINGARIHVHHFVAYFIIVSAVVVIALRTNRIFHPAVLMVLSFLFSAFFYYVWKYTGLHTLIK
ncbi:hypothetical protein HYW40_00915 [Candidatus Curtissbacteria bacterium]|nr:hypothetical protein [Candidatus Curtissbacteria bacterium]